MPKYTPPGPTNAPELSSSGPLNVVGLATVEGALEVSGNALVQGTSQFAQGATFYDTLTVNGHLSGAATAGFVDTVTIEGDANISGSVISKGAMVSGGFGTFANGVVSEGVLEVSGNALVQGTSQFAQGATFYDTLTVMNHLSGAATAGFVDTVTIEGSVHVSGGAIINSDAETALQVGVDTDCVAEIGKVHIGYDGASADVATISHIDMNSNVNYALRQDAVGETAINAAGTKALKLKISSANKLIMDQYGRVGIGAAYSPSYVLDVKQNSSTAYVANFFHSGSDQDRYGIRIQAGATDGAGTTYYVNCYSGDASVNVGYLANIGGTFAATDPSDARLKDNIRDTTLAGLEIVDNIRVRDFEMKKSGISKTGFVAQELKGAYAPAVAGSEDDVETYVISGPTHNDETKEYAPEVTGERPRMMGVGRDILIPVLVKAVQELHVKVKELESKLEE